MDVLSEDGKKLRLTLPPLGKGGEGIVYRVETPLLHLPPQVAKLYKPEKRTAEQEQKIRFLIANPPQVTDGGNHTYLIWPRQLLYDAGGFCGFLMNRAQGEELEKLCLPKLDNTLGPEWQGFAHGTQHARQFRLHICRNLCHAIDALQRKKNYVLGDFKPINVFVTPQSLTTVIDIDSVQVAPPAGGVHFISKLCTPEYTPPEGMGKAVAPLRQTSWDDFSLAISLYRLLTGVHPFAGDYPDPAITEIAAAMQAGLYAHNPKKASLSNYPPPHQHLREYPAEVAELFGRCFDEGLHTPHLRPTAGEWQRTLHQLLDEKPTIDFFTSDQLIVGDTNPIRFAWQVHNAHTLTLSGTGDVTGQTEAWVSVKADTTFVLEATSFSGYKVRERRLVTTDRSPPAILFAATPLIVSEGDTIVLKWQADRAAKISISNGIGDVAGRNSTQVKAKDTGWQRHTLRAESVFGVVSEETVEVEVYPRPQLSKFAPRNSKLKAGQRTELTWKSQHCARLTLREGNISHDVTGQSSFTVEPTADTTYHLVAEGHGGLQTLREKTQVKVFRAVQFSFFQPDRPFTIQTVPTVLRWRVQHQKSLRLTSSGPDLPPDGEDVSGKDHYEITPGSTATYTLFIGHELDTEQQHTTTVNVQPLPRLEGLTLPPMPAVQVAAPPALPDLLGLVGTAYRPGTMPTDSARPLAAPTMPANAMGHWLTRLRDIIQPPAFSTNLSPSTDEQ